ncbi:PREDICTED: zinc finger protein 271-like [Priapulus caudatus]|uniref:Zinc finger protein 271-like n=1 Tax=Priapulus caudatus TaxID=37621 RepID=A0ABM1DT77_PRICU|nr:PREDICTED: zinc finger protein 271-like [Priapulus caudatus]
MGHVKPDHVSDDELVENPGERAHVRFACNVTMSNILLQQDCKSELLTPPGGQTLARDSCGLGAVNEASESIVKCEHCWDRHTATEGCNTGATYSMPEESYLVKHTTLSESLTCEAATWWDRLPLATKTPLQDPATWQHATWRVGTEKLAEAPPGESYACDICGLAFVRLDVLHVHIATHTGERAYACDVCGAAFIINGHLKSHLRIHTGEKPYTCHVCEQRSATHSDLKKHLMVHTGKKPFACDTCAATFARKQHLVSHEQVHTGKRRYQCDVCKLRIASVSDLHKHMRTQPMS